MRVSFPIGHPNNFDSPVKIHEAVHEQLNRWLGKIEPYKMISISISAGWQVWVRLEVQTSILDFQEEK